MFFLQWLKKGRRRALLRSAPGQAPEAMPGDTLGERLSWLRGKLKHCSDIAFHEMSLPGDVPCAFVYIINMIDQKLLQEQVITPLLSLADGLTAGELAHQVSVLKRLPVSYVETASNAGQALDALFEGTVLLLIGDHTPFIQFPLRKVEKMSIQPAQDENVIRGPKEAFVEDINTNLTMIRRRIKHPAFKTEQYQMGKYSKTTVIICYIEGICTQELLNEVKQRMSRIDVDSVLGSSYIEEFIEDNPFSPFPQLQYTERPDTAAASLLEGRVAILVDGTPMLILLPVTLYMLLQSAEDYYQRFVASTWIRWIRFMFLLISFLLPSTYIAVTTFHPEMLPHNLLLTVAAARESVPFPAIVEAFIMEITFEALREAGLRIPKPIGQTVSIIGALVIGQSAVQAGIVSAPMVIVVSITGVASFIIPHFDLGLTFRLLRFPVMILAASFGLYGIIVAIILIYIHLVTLRSFGTPYLTPTAPIHFSDWKDVLIRAPFWMLKKRPILYGTSHGQRLTYRKRPQIPQEDDGD
ncbi:spore germination protein [Paenibacillus hamazuiensis]|uniref:spore germination protein n=1 Tax=Paenibacillus hamazuiensis TaxID=2936508 RepID=UPI00200D5B33|nr:spore germination protein [Paenibacillus hamazuiensis]